MHTTRCPAPPPQHRRRPGAPLAAGLGWRRPALLGATALLLGACPGPGGPDGKAGPQAPAQAAPAQEVVVAVVGTSDLHGHVEPETFTVTDGAGAGAPREVARGGLPLFGGYLENLRRRLPTVVLDAGDLFQGTLASNLSEGQVVIDAYNLLGYSAAAVGNHEFDYGPVGPRSVPKAGTDDDAVGALKARIAAAKFPFLTANVLEEGTGRPVAWENTFPSRLVEVPGVPGLRVGLIGGTAEDTPHTTNPLNLRGLRIDKVVPAVQAQARALRDQGAAAVLLTVHEGGDCKGFGDPRDLAPCGGVDGREGRVLRMAAALRGDVDAIVAGHSHAGVAHFVGDVAVIQSFMGHRYFGRLDLSFRRDAAGRFAVDREKTRIHPPQEICSVQPGQVVPVAVSRPGQVEGRLEGLRAGPGGRHDRCVKAELAGKPLAPARYEGAEVAARADVAAVIAPHAERAAGKRREALGVTLSRKLGRSYRAESELGRLLADLIREGAEAATKQRVDVAFQNGGGIRSELPTGELTYGAVYEVLPFDNRLALMRVPGSALVELMRRNLGGSGGVLVPAGLSGEARCAGGELQLSLKDGAGKPLAPGRLYTVAVSDFLAAGGDNFGAILSQLPPNAVTYYDDLPPLRELVLAALKRRGAQAFGTGDSPLRLRSEAPRPLRCGAPSGAAAGGQGDSAAQKEAQGSGGGDPSP